ncbi:lysoplasmalogenase [Vibrio clamense]|uniref:lysoplasmalogenase n=1 Tax=Vibrio TaxID=662 RepID=UPI000DE9E36D|nr:MULTISPECIES: lysoplasmalogenase [Vibrio]MDN3696646.1 lysoplasmalogenase [Vibrio cortegadensis]NOH85582.1 lysoplasmalogenase [Vibrio sp. 03-59-1]RBW64475.1 lysoplasmalogenase [Vibrionales bacterium C3R12]TKF18778.1 lysoplasmalogenase [Vibrio genomosp. F6]
MWSWLAVSLSGYICISAANRGERTHSLAAKVFTLLLLILIVLTEVQTQSTAFWMVSGLALFMFSDVLHVLTEKRVLPFIGFLIAQICYSKLFWLQLSGDIVWWLPALLLATSIVAFLLLLPQLDSFLFPATIMGIVLIQLSWASGELWLLEPTLGHSLGFIGCFILIFSGLMFVINSYRKPIRGANYWISGSYFLAHALIVSSIIF